ncbi:MAG: hypothetical protein R3E95_22810 [Thiolinea sp.]
MSRIVYVNGEFVPEQDAKISVFDRAFCLPTVCMKSPRCCKAK